MAIYYHGTSAEPFEKFSLDHALEGDGKVKFGDGVYVTPKYSRAEETDRRFYFHYKKILIQGYIPA